MEDNRIKSAREIAMEKVARMPDLTPEERRQQKEREFRPRGEAIARRYLAGAIRDAALRTELGKYRGEEGRMVVAAFVSFMCQSIGLEDFDQSHRATEGMRSALANDSDLDEMRKELEETRAKFEQAARQAYLAFETKEKERLAGLGISGSAVRPNPNENEGWQQELAEIRLRCAPELDQLKAKLIERIKN